MVERTTTFVVGLGHSLGGRSVEAEAWLEGLGGSRSDAAPVDGRLRS